MKLTRNISLEHAILTQLSQKYNKQLIAYCYKDVDSILDVAKDVDDLLPGQIALLLAEKQNKGRGQQGRTWTSVEGAFLGCLLFPNCAIEKKDLPAFSLVVSLQIAKILQDYGIEVATKWPNDILIEKNNKKISGVLLETDSDSVGSSYALRVGIGVNLLDYPDGGSSAYEECGKKIAIEEFAAKLASRCLAAFEIYSQKGFKEFEPAWNKLDILIGREISFQYGDKIVSGIVSGVDINGHICIKTKSEVLSFATGQIIEWAKED